MPEGKGLTQARIDELLNSNADESISRRIQRQEDDPGRRETRKEWMQKVSDLAAAVGDSRDRVKADVPPREGGPRRPYWDEGALVEPRKTPRDAKALFSTCEEQLVKHLSAVCLWPEAERNRSWRVGDHSFYILDYSPSPETGLYVQFWSEPDEDSAIFEVSSGAWHPPTEAFVDAAKRKLLRDRGFELGGEASNFRKMIRIGDARDVRAAAREAMEIFTTVLGYDGTHELRYQLALMTPQQEPSSETANSSSRGTPAKKDERPMREKLKDFLQEGDEMMEEDLEAYGKKYAITGVQSPKRELKSRKRGKQDGATSSK